MLRTAHARVASRLLLLLSERLDVLLTRVGQLRGVDVGRLLLHRLVRRRGSLMLSEELVEVTLRSAALLRGGRSHGVALLTAWRSASTVDLRSRSTATAAVHHHLPKQLVLNLRCVGRRKSSRAKTERRGRDGLLSEDGLLVLRRGGTHARSWAATTHLLELAQLVD